MDQKIKMLMPKSNKEIEIKSPDLMEAVKQVQAAIKVCGCTPLYYEISVKYDQDED